MARLNRIRQEIPTLRTALVTWQQVPPSTARAAGGLVIDARVVTDAYLATLGSLPVYVFNADTPAEWERLLGKVTAVVTNDAPGYIVWRAEACTTV